MFKIKIDRYIHDHNPQILILDHFFRKYQVYYQVQISGNKGSSMEALH